MKNMLSRSASTQHLWSVLALAIVMSALPFPQALPAQSSAVCQTDQSDGTWYINQSLYGSSRRADCFYQSNYNCNGFSIAYYEDGIPPPTGGVYNAPMTQGIQPESAFQNSAKYVQVCAEPQASITSWKTNSGGVHSAIRVDNSGNPHYLSKYGPDGPLVQHPLQNSFYHLAYPGQNTDFKYWAYIGTIIGSTNINGNSAVTYAIANRPGVQYQWSIVSGSDKISIPGSSNGSSVSVQPVHSGTAVLKLTATSTGCGAVPKIQQLTIQVATGNCIEALYSNGANSNKVLNTVNSVSVGQVTTIASCPTPAPPAQSITYTWVKTSGSINQFYPNGASMSFPMASGGTLSLTLTARQGSTVVSTRNVTFYNYGSFRMSTEPGSGDILIDLNPDLDFDIEIVDMRTGVKRSQRSFANNSRLRRSALPPGQYAIVISYCGELLSSQQLHVN